MSPPKARDSLSSSLLYLCSMWIITTIYYKKSLFKNKKQPCLSNNIGKIKNLQVSWTSFIDFFFLTDNKILSNINLTCSSVSQLKSPYRRCSGKDSQWWRRATERAGRADASRPASDVNSGSGQQNLRVPLPDSRPLTAQARMTRISIFQDLSGSKRKQTGRGTLGNTKQCESTDTWRD